MSYTRREVGQIALATLAVPSLFPSRAEAQTLRDATINGVVVGSQTYSFRAINNPATQIIAAMRNIGLYSAELMSGDAENLAGLPGMPNFGEAGRRGGPPLTADQQAQMKAAQEAQQKWRMSTSPETWGRVRRMWNHAGIDVRFLTFNMGANVTDDQIEYGFQMAKGLGVRAITTSTTVAMTKRIAPFANKHRMIVAAHGHANIKDPNQISTEATFLECFAASKYIWANLDIGHYTATNGDPVAFIQKHHGRITNLHVKDRKNLTNGGANTPFGQGDTPIREVLQLLKKSRWDIAANVEFEYTPNDPLAEMPKCLQFIKDALA
jgi:sugar phosphate isomerase/epimerase